MEPHASTAWIESDGVLTVSTSTQGIFYVRKQLAKIFGRPMNKVRVRAAPLGGSFGSKVVLVDPLAAGAALVLRRPVRVAFDRREDMAGTNPAPGSRIDVRIGATADGTLTGLDARLVFDTGAYIEWSIEGIAAVLIGGGLPLVGVRRPGLRRRTNRFGTGSYRGPGGPQAAFALESLIDELADKLGIDAIELRTRNLVAEGDADGRRRAMAGSRPRGRPRGGPGASALAGPHDLPPDEGVGVAFGVWPGGKAPAAAAVPLNADGSITITTGVVDMSGTTGAFQVIAAETFGIDPSRVEVVALDTDGAPQSPLSGGSVITYSSGRAIREAAADARRQMLAYAALEMEIDPADLEIVDGVIRPVGSPGYGPADRRVRRGPPRLQQRVPADRGPRLDRPGQPRPVDRRTHRPRPPRPGDRRRRRSSATSCRRTSGGRSTRPSSRARCAARPPRASAGRCTRSSSTTTRASCCRARSWTTRCRGRPGPGHRHAHRRGPRARRPVRCQGHRRGVGHPGRCRGRLGHRGGRRPAPARDADDPATRLGRRARARLIAVPATTHPGAVIHYWDHLVITLRDGPPAPRRAS